MRVKKEINIQIGEQMKLAREQAKLTQEQFAELLEVSPQYISDLERGVVGISIATLKRACRILRVSSDQILMGNGSENRVAVITEMCNSLSDEHFRILTEIIARYVDAIELTEQR